MPTYVNPHSSGTGWNYQKAVPRWLKALFPAYFGSHFTGYISATNKTEAMKVAARHADRDDAVVQYLKTATEEERREFVGAGGLEGLRRRVAVHRPAAWLTAPVPANTRVADWRADDIQLARLKTLRLQQWENETLEKVTALQTAPGAEYTWAALYKLWLKKGCKKQGAHGRARDLLAEHFGNVDIRKITRGEMKTFRNWLESYVQESGQTIPAPMRKALMNAVKGMFSVAVDKLPDFDESPADGINVDAPKGRRAAFSGSQIKTILQKAEETRWGGKRRAETKWLLMLCTYQGLRINEVSQLRRDDIRVARIVRGGETHLVPYLHIREGDDQSLKTGAAAERKVPLHRACGGFLEFAKNAKDEFIFGAFPPNPNNGRGFWVTNNFKKFRINVCGITEGKVTWHSLRHSFVTARRKAGVSKEMGEFLTGHSSQGAEGEYGKMDLFELSLLLNKIDPLSIEG